MFSTWARNVREMRGGKRGRNPVFSSAKGYPMAIEREFSQYLRRVLMELVERMTEAALSGLNVAQDDLSDLNGGDFPLPADFGDRVKSFGTSLELFSRQRMAEESFMIVGERYIPGAVKEELIGNWCENMQVLCKTTTAENKAKISQIVGQGVARGENLESIKKEIGKVVPEYTKNHVELVARTEIGKLNGAIKRAQYEESGIEYYKWMSGRDDRVRPTHAAMNGVICSLTDPDVYYEETPEGLVKHQRTGSMVHLHPGDDFQCRCTMVMWDPEIDGKYEVKESPKVEQEKKPTALELEREKTAKAEAELEKARAEKEAAERRAEKIGRKNASVETALNKVNTFAKKKLKQDAQRNRNIPYDIDLFPKLGRSESIEEAAKNANPNYDPIKEGWSNNCQRSVIAYLLRRKGYDVKAKPCPVVDFFDNPGKNLDSDGWTYAFTKIGENLFNSKHFHNVKQIEDAFIALLNNSGDGDVFVLRYKTRAINFGNKSHDTTGHVMIVEKKGESLVFADPQTGEIGKPDIHLLKEKTIKIYRVDNLTISLNILELVS